MHQSNSISPALRDFDQLPDSAHVRLPVVAALYACSSASVWRGVKNLTIPKPHKLSPRTTCWNVGELKKSTWNESECLIMTFSKATQKTLGKFSRKDLPSSITYYEKQNIKLKGSGAWRDAICPFHADTKPSLRVNVERGGYRCFVCGARGGDVLAFHMNKHRLGFIDAAKELGAWVGG